MEVHRGVLYYFWLFRWNCIDKFASNILFPSPLYSFGDPTFQIKEKNVPPELINDEFTTPYTADANYTTRHDRPYYFPRISMGTGNVLSSSFGYDLFSGMSCFVTLHSLLVHMSIFALH